MSLDTSSCHSKSAFNNSKTYNNATVVGLDLILGLDYKFKSLPVNIGIDVKPFVDVFDGTSLFMDVGLSVRITI